MNWHANVAPEILQSINEALQSGAQLKIKYRAEHGPKTGRAVDGVLGPECLYFSNGGVFLIATDLAKGEARTYTVSRFTEVKILDASKYNKRGLSPEALFAGTLGLKLGEVEIVEVLIRGPAAQYYADRVWHPSQHSEAHDSQSTLFTFEVKIDDDLARFVLGMGSAAKVLKPEKLKAAVQNAAAGVLDHYPRKAS